MSCTANIEVANWQSVRRLRLRRIRRLTGYLMAQAARLAPGSRWRHVSLVLADDRQMAGLNERYLGREGTTDVLSFRYSVDLPACPLDGEIIVNVERAVAAGPRHGGAGRELALYIAHGCDHLLDERDEGPAERARMRRRELRWLRGADRLGLLDELIAGRALHAW